MKIIIDIEANGLENPTKIWCIVCKDIDTGDIHVFREDSVFKDADRVGNIRPVSEFREFAKGVCWFIGHNFLGYDCPVLVNLLHFDARDIHARCTDTLIVSKMFDFERQGHSLADFGLEFGFPKGIPIGNDKELIEAKHIPQSFYNTYSIDLENYCKRDVDITLKVYLKYLKYINKYKDCISTEQEFQGIVNLLHINGFYFNRDKCNNLLDKVKIELSTLDQDILNAFPPKLKLIREIHPKVTKHGTLSKTDFRWVLDGDLSVFNGGPFCRCDWVPFNPSSHRQIVDVLNQAGWKPVDKTQTHKDLEREINQLSKKRRTAELDIKLKNLYTVLDNARRTGWKVNEQNLETLPPRAPAPARALAKRILLESRRRTLTEWLGLVQDDNRIHGEFYGIGAWTQRMAHQKPNTANIPNEFDTAGKRKLLGKEMRSLWQAPRNRLLVGVDAEGIQLRIFAHLIDDAEFTLSLVEGKKDDKTDPHSLNQRILGSVCPSRAAAKRFIYALLLGAGMPKLAEILGCSIPEAEEALARLLRRYQGFEFLKREVIPKDARRGYFVGLDGRPVGIPGDTEGSRRHLAMSGYLQNGEAVVMKKSAIKWHKKLTEEKVDFLLVNFVHDEWQTETENNMETALYIAKTQADSLRIVGEELNLKCPLAGSYWNEDLKDYTIATNWAYTH